MSIDPNKVDLIAMIKSALHIVDHKFTKPCPDCEGTGLDKDHKWPDGSYATCETCNGYKTINV